MKKSIFTFNEVSSTILENLKEDNIEIKLYEKE